MYSATVVFQKVGYSFNVYSVAFVVCSPLKSIGQLSRDSFGWKTQC